MVTPRFRKKKKQKLNKHPVFTTITNIASIQHLCKNIDKNNYKRIPLLLITIYICLRNNASSYKLRYPYRNILNKCI